MLATQANEIHVLYIDHEKHNLNSFTATFRKIFRVSTANSLKAAETICMSNNIHVIIIDQYLLTKAGTKLLFFAIKYIHQTRILLTGFADTDHLETAVRDGHIYAYFQKPWNETKLRNAIEGGYILYDQRQRN
ncbi:MAG: response regulator [Bacteroidota bacterium]